MRRFRIPVRWGEDTGSASIMLVTLAVALLAVVGLVVDGGGKARALTRADDIAAGAARAGGQSVSVSNYYATGTVKVDPVKARAAAQAYLAGAGVAGSATVGDAGSTLTVTTHASYEPVFLSIVGIGSMGVTGKATVDLVTVKSGEAQ